MSTTTAVYGLSLASLALVEERTRSSTQSGLVLLSSILPAFLGSLVAGAIVDRFGRTRMLRLGHLARALALLFFWAGSTWLPLGPALVIIYAASAAAAFMSQFSAAAELALLPNLAGPERLLAANSLFQFGMLAGEGLGIVALGPLVVKLAGAPAMGLLGALFCTLALFLVWGLPQDAASAGRAGAHWSGWTAFGADLREGWRNIGRDRLLRLVAVQATLAAALLLVLLSLLPGLVARQLDLSVENAPYVILPGGVGFALGTVLVNHWEKSLSRQLWIAVGLLAVGLSVLLLALLSRDTAPAQLPLFLLAALGLGLGLGPVVISARTVFQERPPAEVRGRVVAAQLALSNATAVVPLLLGGALADKLGFAPVLAVLGGLALLSGLFGLRGG
ncbi:MAG: MFS transporter [Chloroflexia bacterium]|nr:MFS transporter [Chloroflexia bacterium]